MTKPAVAIVQARMGASRLPNKMMLWLHGLPVVEWVYHRVSSAKSLDKVVFALPESKAEDALAEYLQLLGALVFRGKEQDVLDRFYQAALNFGVKTVVRVCADNPFVAGSEIDQLVEFFNQNDFDYAYNHIPRGNRYPDGLGAEIASISLLGRIHREATEPSQREHVFNYIWDFPDRFRIGTFDPIDESIAHPELKLDLDTMDDYEKLLQLPVHPDMSASEIVAMALKRQGRR